MCGRHEMLDGRADPSCPDCQPQQPESSERIENRNTDSMDKCPDCGSVDLRPRSYGYYCQGCQKKHE